MDNSNEFDLDSYIEKICSTAEVDPYDDVFEGSKYSDEGMSLSFHDLMLSAITSNWDPAYNENAQDILSNKSKFVEFILNTDMQSGLPPKQCFINYLEFVKKYFKYGFFISNLNHANYLTIQLDSIFDSSSHVPILGEPGVGKYSIAELIHHESERSDFPFETIDCSGHSDEQLCSIVFGSVNRENNETYSGILKTADKGTLYLEDLHQSKNTFQSKLIRFLRDGTYSMVGSDELLKSTIRIIGSVTDTEYDKSIEQNLYVKPGLFSNFSLPSIILPAIRLVRSNIPLLIYLHIQKAKHKFNINKDTSINIPFFILQYWITQENWIENLYRLQAVIECYCKTYINNIKPGEGPGDHTFSRWPNSISSVNIDPKGYRFFKIPSKEKKAVIEYATMAGSLEICNYLNSSSYIDISIFEPFELFDTPLLLLMLYYQDVETKKEGIRYSAYNDLSSFQTDFGIDKLLLSIKGTDKIAKDTEYDKPVLESFKEKRKKKLNINKIIAEVYENSDEFPTIIYVPSDGSQAKGLEYSQDVRAEISLFVFLIYEKTKTKKDGTPNTVNWGINWLANMEREEFQPFLDVCRWFGYTEEDLKNSRPAWWYNLNTLRSYLSRLKIIFKDNEIYDKLITRHSRKGKSSIYRLHKDLEAAIIIKQ